MSSKDWVREFFFQTYVAGDTAALEAPNVFGVLPAYTPNDILKRVIVDAKISITINDTVGGGPADDWWGAVMPMLAVGRDKNTGHTPLHIASNLPDKRITGTATLYLRNVQVPFSTPGFHQATYGLLEVLDTHGARDPIVGGDLPVVNITGQVYPDETVFADYFEYDVRWFIWARALWETP